MQISLRTYFMPYANNKGADQPAHPCSLIITFVVRCLDSIIHTGSYMSAHVLLNLLNELGKKMM